MSRMFTSTHTANQNQTSVRWTRSMFIALSLLSFAAPVCAQGTVMPSPVFTAFDSNGNPISSGKLCVYVAGSSTFANTYTDSTLGVANQNPVVMSAAGRATVFLTPGASYKFVLRAAGSSSTECTTGAIQWTVDQVGAVPTSSNNLDVLGTAGEAITAGQAVYLSDGSGSKTAGQWYKTDATLPYASTTGIVGLAPTAISSVTAGTIRLNGTVTGLSSLTVGATYYVSATAGAITATAPTNNRRLVGVADTTGSLVLNANPNVPAVNLTDCNGRLTLTTLTPVTTADVTAATTLYWTPYRGNRCALYDGTWWTTRTFAELSIAIPATTSQMYDVWLIDTAGTLGLELLAWTNDTTRATALTTQDGVWVKTGVLTRRYLGSVRTTTVSGQTEDSLTKRYVSNAYNRVVRPLRLFYDTAYTYTTATFRQANAVATNQVEIVNGLAEGPIDVWVQTSIFSATVAGVTMVHIGEDSTTTPSTDSFAGQFQIQSVSQSNPLSAHLTKLPAVGWHRYVWLEYGATGGNWNASIAGSGSPRNGMLGMFAN